MSLRRVARAQWRKEGSWQSYRFEVSHHSDDRIFDVTIARLHLGGDDMTAIEEGKDILRPGDDPETSGVLLTHDRIEELLPDEKATIVSSFMMRQTDTYWCSINFTGSIRVMSSSASAVTANLDHYRANRKFLS